MNKKEQKESQKKVTPEEKAEASEKESANPETVSKKDETAAQAEKKEPTELEKLQEKYEELNNLHLRTLAEYDNYRKRTAREKDAVYPTAVASTIEKLLPVVDNFERALQCECADEEFKKGISMISDSLNKFLSDLSVKEIGNVGDTFDANFHNAVMHVDDENLGENVIAAVLQKGYAIGDRIIRYAMVTVAN